MTPRKSLPSGWQRHVSGVAAVVLFGMSVALLIASVRGNWDQVSRVIRRSSPIGLATAFAAAVAAMATIALAWWKVIEALGSTVARVTAVRCYFLGEIGKYLPGGVWSVLGRSELLARRGVPRSQSYAGVMLSLALFYGVGALIAGALLPFTRGLDVPLWSVAVVGGAALALLRPRTMASISGVLDRLVRRPIGLRLPARAELLRLLIIYMLPWAAVIAATSLTARAIEADFGIATLAGATTLSWVAGFLAVPVPGGIGVREAVFVGAIGGLAAEALALALLTRFVFVLADLVGALGAAGAQAWGRYAVARRGRT